jgi:hypothetical protein
MEHTMNVDISSRIKIMRPRVEVASYSINPDNARDWVANLKSVNWKTQPPLAVGSRIGLISDSFGRRLEYIYDVVALAPGERLVMRAVCPFPMEMRYLWESTDDGGTRMTLRGRGELIGLSFLIAPLIRSELRRVYDNNLRRLKKILESTV